MYQVLMKTKVETFRSFFLEYLYIYIYMDACNINHPYPSFQDKSTAKMLVRDLMPTPNINHVSTSHSTGRNNSNEQFTESQSKELVSPITKNMQLYLPQRIVIIMSGYRYETLECTLAVFPDTLLGNPLRRREYYDPSSGGLRFFRDPISFDAILFYYQSKGILARPKNIERNVFQGEVEFFGITTPFDKRHQFEQNMLKEQEKEPEMPRNFVRKYLWSTFEYPHSSCFASAVGLLSTAIILISVASLCLETIPELKPGKTETVVNVTEGNTTKEITKTIYGHDYWYTVESYCIAWFTFEYLMRLFSAPSVFGFAFSYLGLVDLVSVTPFYVTLIIRQKSAGKNLITTFGILRMLRLLRIIRVFKLTRYNEGLRILLMTIYESSVHLKSILLVIAIMAVFFATIVFYAESFARGLSGKSFESIPDTFWYSIITMTTVGYGDVYPQTVFGKFCGTLCAIFGVLLFCLPSPVLVNKFIECYYLRKTLPENESDERKAFVESMKEIYFKGT